MIKKWPRGIWYHAHDKEINEAKKKVIIDEERARISVNGTKVDEKSFLEWKKKRDEFRKIEEAEKVEQEKKLHQKSKLTGVQLFKKQAELFKDDEDAQDLKEEQEQEKKEREEEEGTINPDKDQVMEGVLGKEEKNENEINELDEGLKDVKINEDLFKEDANLDELDDIGDDEDKKEDDKKEDEKEE